LSGPSSHTPYAPEVQREGGLRGVKTWLRPEGKESGWPSLLNDKR